MESCVILIDKQVILELSLKIIFAQKSTLFQRDVLFLINAAVFNSKHENADEIEYEVIKMAVYNDIGWIEYELRDDLKKVNEEIEQHKKDVSLFTLNPEHEATVLSELLQKRNSLNKATEILMKSTTHIQIPVCHCGIFQDVEIQVHRLKEKPTIQVKAHGVKKDFVFD